MILTRSGVFRRIYLVCDSLPLGQDAALQKGHKLVFNKLGQAGSCLELDLGEKGLDVFLDHLIQRGLLWAPAFVGRRRPTLFSLDRCLSPPIPIDEALGCRSGPRTSPSVVLSAGWPKT